MPKGSKGHQWSPDFLEEGISTEVKGYYQTLGISIDASLEDIKKAFRPGGINAVVDISSESSNSWTDCKVYMPKPQPKFSTV